MNDDNPTTPLPRLDDTTEPRRRSWRRPALIAGAVIVAVGLTGGSAALAAQTNGGSSTAAATSAPSADGGSVGPGAGTTPSACLLYTSDAADE
ncbi:hypothetical protein [Microbacterium proteolyticum]|uniref:hypothetical protein n=1 Tax=Microbacterium proteolyticum TaxID=1572644 RepID=UPI001FAD68AA|nr:hypothetical protein [Microbacterium proteolyticum]MCI9856877.1 hypothetical protein [Microbacterium proteolyticum]